VDTIAAARAVIAGDARAVPKTTDGLVDALRTLKLVQRSATKARTALSQLHSLVVTASEDVRARLRRLPRRELLQTCAAFRVRPDDSIAASLVSCLRELARRVGHLDDQPECSEQQIRRITTAVAPALLSIKGIGTDHAANAGVELQEWGELRPRRFHSLLIAGYRWPQLSLNPDECLEGGRFRLGRCRRA
jgi:hypothetical protein